MNKQNENTSLKINEDADKRQIDLRVIPPPNTFLNIDCMELMKKCPDGYFDLAIVDNSPYIGVTTARSIK
jgi:hypothetical protein